MSAPSAHHIPDKAPGGLVGWLARWETLLLLLFLTVIVVNSLLSPYFLNLSGLLYATSDFSEKALIALPMALVILARDIDVSVSSIAALAAVAVGLVAETGAGIAELIAVGVFVGLLAGLFNGLLITRLGIDSIVVTIGTLSLYRGIAVVLIGERALTHFPPNYGFIGQGMVFGLVPLPFVLFLGFAIVFGVFLHLTGFGRKIYAIGSSPEGAFFSGVRVDHYRLVLFCLTGAFSGLAAVILSSRLLSVRLNVATGWELDIITMVVLGGVSIAGGVGTIAGVVLSVLVIGYLTFGLSLINVPSILMSIFTGVLLIAAIGLPKLFAVLGRRRRLAAPKPDTG